MSFVSCRGSAFLVAPIRIGALVVAFATMPAAAQTISPSGMRPTIDGDADTAAPRRTRTPPQSTNSTPAGQLPMFAVPAGRGAGKTGFVSTNIRRKKKARPGTKASDTAGSGVQLLPSGTLPIPGQPLSSEKPKAKASAATKAKGAQTPARPVGTSPAQRNRPLKAAGWRCREGEIRLPAPLRRRGRRAGRGPSSKGAVRRAR